MNEKDWLAAQFEAQRARLRGVAYRMLGSLSEADDAVQEAWMHVARAGGGDVANLGGWLTTIVARVCLDMLRSRKSRREEPAGDRVPEPAVDVARAPTAESEAVLADNVGLALLVVLETLAPAERIAFVLHDLFAVSFDEIAPIVGRTPAATRQLASRARRRVRGERGAPAEEADLAAQRSVVDAFLTALRAGDFEAVVAVLDPDVVVHVDDPSGPPGAQREVRGARNWARGAVAFSRSAAGAQAALVDGDAGVVMAPGGRLSRALRFRIVGGKIAEVDVVVHPDRVAELEIDVLPP